MPCDSHSFVTRLIASFGAVSSGLGLRDLVVRDAYALSTPAVLAVQSSDSVHRCSRASEEVQDHGVRLIGHEEPKAVLNCVERLRERELAVRQQGLQEA